MTLVIVLLVLARGHSLSQGAQTFSIISLDPPEYPQFSGAGAKAGSRSLSTLATRLVSSRLA